jgi:hypothetical protein
VPYLVGDPPHPHYLPSAPAIDDGRVRERRLALRVSNTSRLSEGRLNKNPILATRVSFASGNFISRAFQEL